ncbi:hypothetical protein LPB85_02725 [Chryseobacterium sp. LC2016-27]|jgi:hypothetical protein|uniref:hypothetical protein n=1 Tax=Chryseobacterium sp. LC2016-27 TaxID=2897326 RepID=UPI001E59637B|nr:hypothetical protein [Chryseobacterium sp. LC2016-27]MCD0454361.1 hypothetical protein [Chryseobacterium sp. LC2016-27]
MKPTLYFIFILIFCLSIVSCKKEKKIQQNFEKFVVDESLPQNDTIKLLSKYPELKLYRTDVNESKSRTAYIVQESTIWNMSGRFDNYKCKTNLKDDTLNISLNNNNKQSGNGALVKVFNGNFFIKDYDPKTLKGEDKFIPAKAIYQKLVLNKDKFKKNDSIYGFIDYKSLLDDDIKKTFRGYFRALIK